MIRPRMCGGTIVMMVAMSSGVMMAVPVACTTRPVTRIAKPGAIIASAVPAVNSAIASR